MRKRSKYRPKGVRLDVVNYVIAGVRPVSMAGDALINLKIKNHSAMDDLTKGRANKDTIDTIIQALNMAEAYAIHGKGIDWIEEIRQAQTALLTMARRGLEKGKFLLTGEEMKAMNLAMDIHDAQLEQSTVKELERMADYVIKQIVHKKATPIETRRQSKKEPELQG